MRRLVPVLAAVVLIFGIVLTTAQAEVKPGWPKGVTIGAAPLGGTYFVWAGGFAKLLNDKVGVPANVESTGGPVHNTQLLQAKLLDFGMMTSGPVYEGYTGDPDGWSKGKKHPDLRIIFPMYTTYFQMYSLASTGIKSIMDLNGKSVCVGPVGGTPATYWPKILNAAGIKPKRIINASSSDGNSQLKDGMLDANGNSVGLPWVTITETQTTHDVNAYGVPEDVGKKIVEKIPSFSVGYVPKGTYKSNPDNDFPTLTMWNFMAVHKDAPEDFVYEVVKATFDNVDILIAAHKSAREVKPEAIVFSPIPLHPGAVKYYKEKGIALPEALIVK
jgi:TRAP transporter TAXI family solute receptor